MSIQEQNPSFHSFAKELKTQGYDAYNPNCRSAQRRTKQCVGIVDGREINVHSPIKMCKQSRDYYLQKHKHFNSCIKTRLRLRMKLEQKNQSKPQDEDVPGVPQDKRV